MQTLAKQEEFDDEDDWNPCKVQNPLDIINPETLNGGCSKIIVHPINYTSNIKGCWSLFDATGDMLPR